MTACCFSLCCIFSMSLCVCLYFLPAYHISYMVCKVCIYHGASKYLHCVSCLRCFYITVQFLCVSFEAGYSKSSFAHVYCTMFVVYVTFACNFATFLDDIMSLCNFSMCCICMINQFNMCKSLHLLNIEHDE